jgi:alpha-tubulin suppressor-like RCC1 family protein
MSSIGMRGALLLAAFVTMPVLMIAAAPPLAGSAPGTSPGQLYAFGENEFGQLGKEEHSGTEEPNPTPALATLPGATGPVTQVAAGEGHSLAVTSTGQLYAFGENRYGQLGNASNEETTNPNPTPAHVTLPGATGPVTEVAAGGFHSLAVTSTGQLYAFGENRYGQLGNATNEETTNPNPTPALVTLPGATGPVTQVAAGGYHSLAVTSTGQLYAFGYNFFGQLGNASNEETTEPNPTPALISLPGATGPVTQVAAGAYHSLAVTSTGQLYAFGDNNFGQLGNATHEKTGQPNPTPVLVSLPGATGPVTQVAAGRGHTLALTSTGQLYAFGENRYGQLGNATNEKTEEPNPTPALASLPDAAGRAVQVAAGYEHSLALTSTGQLYAFGENRYGQLGNATNNKSQEPNGTPTLVSLPGGGSSDTMARGPMAYNALVVVADLAVATSSLPGGQTGIPYSAQLEGLGGAAPYQWAASGLPPGLSIGAASGAISGTPSVTGSFTATFTVTDTDGIEASAPLTITIGAATANSTATTASTATSNVAGGAPRSGTAEALAAATVKGSKALVKLTCTGTGACAGSLQLVARVSQKAGAKGHGKGRAREHVGKIGIGTASFSIAQGKTETVQVPLSAKGRALLRSAGKRGLKVTAHGSDVRTGTVVLRSSAHGS